MGKMERQIKKNKEKNNGLKVLAGNSAKGQSKLQSAASGLRTYSEEDMEKIKNDLFISGLKTGMEKSFLFALDCLEYALESTNGIGEKRGKEVKDHYLRNLYNKEQFDKTMDSNRESLYSFGVSNEMAHKIGEEISGKEDEFSELTYSTIMSILRDIKTDEQLQSVKEHIDSLLK